MGSYYQTGLLFILTTAAITFVVYLTATATEHNHKISPPPFKKAHPFHALKVCMLSKPPPTPPKIVQPVQLPIKSILYWTTTFGRRNNEKLHELDCGSPFKCQFTGDAKGKPEDFDALIFHTRDPQKPPAKRKPNQIYVAYTWESPTNRGGSFVNGNFYNWSWTYMTGSDIRFVHGTLLPGKAKLQIEDLPQLKVNTSTGNKVLWVVSNCRAGSRRHLYINKLKQHISVDIYGRCGKRCPRETGNNDGACYDHAAKSGQYKFYLAFENSACKDYISLKPFRALEAGLVPIVFGGLNADEYYNGILPPNSFIDSRNFNSPQHLAEFLQKLAKDEARYVTYHAWREKTKVGGADSHMCAVCRKLYDEQYRARPRELDWGKFWDPAKLCDNSLVDRLIGR